MDRRRAFLLSALALALAAALCLTLEKYDNKYTNDATQPISGVLMLTEDEFAAQPVRYLAREWRFYPGVLLTPAGDQSGYHRYLDIGERSTLPEDCGSYGLTLLLPDEPGEYALELPEVYTACRLYLNGVLMLELGDLETGKPLLGSRLVLFTASGRTELLVAVRSGGAVYGGMTYPPAFGTADAVVSLRQARLTLHSFFAMLTLLLMVLAASFGWRGSRRRGFLAVTGAICALAAVGRPLLYGLCTVGYQPWAAVEIACRYGVLLVAVLLQLEIYGLWRKRGLLSALPCGLGLMLAVFCSVGASVLPELVMTVFSGVTAVLKLYSAALLVVISAWALLRGQRYSALLLCGSIAMAVCLTFDRLFPLYEPILGGWYPETGAVLLTASLAVALWKDAIDAYRFRLAYGEQQALLARELALQKEYYRQLSEQIELSRQASHDLRHHLRTLKAMADQGGTEKISAYLTEYGDHLAQREVTTYSEHPVADAVIGHYAAESKRMDADCDLHFQVSTGLGFPDDELCILLGNLLENAVAAMAAQKSGRRSLYLRGGVEDGRLGLVVDNSFDGSLRERDGVFLSTKHEGPGLGLASVRAVVEKYGGLVDFSAADDIFHVELLVPLPDNGL